MLKLRGPMLSLIRSGCMRPCTLWTITRTDGVVLRFTDHDTPLVVDGQTFEPAAADVSARQKRAGLDGQNREFKGGLDSERITHDDLAAGRYRGATVLEQVVDWRYPWLGEYERASYDISETTFTGESWSAQIDGLSIRLSRPKGRVYTRDCDAYFGDARCLAGSPGLSSAAPYTYTGFAVTGLVTDRLDINTNLSITDNFFNFGHLTWTSGNNVGIACDIQKSWSASGRFRFEIATPYAIQIGDTFTAVAGCDGNFTTCQSKFGNAANFRGHPHQPGVNEVLKVPDPK